MSQGPWQQGDYSYPPQGGYPSYQQGNQYLPSNPYGAPAVPAQNPADYPRPAPVEVAFWIGIVVPIVATVLGVLNVVFAQQWVSGLVSPAALGAGANPSDAQNIQKIVSTVVVVFGGVIAFFWLVLTVLWIVFAFKMRAGRNWARITLTVFASIWVASGAYTLVNAVAGNAAYLQLPAGLQQPSSMVITGFVSGAIGLVSMGTFIAMVFLKPSNWYFQAHRLR